MKQSRKWNLFEAQGMKMAMSSDDFGRDLSAVEALQRRRLLNVKCPLGSGKSLSMK